MQLILGIASVTPFIVKCENWLAWRAPPNTTLEYDFRIRAPGTPAATAFPFFFGSENMRIPVSFPVGVVAKEFQLEVAAWIIDTLGDYYELIETVTVRYCSNQAQYDMTLRTALLWLRPYITQEFKPLKDTPYLAPTSGLCLLRWFSITF